jgi:hypothetical protein
MNPMRIFTAALIALLLSCSSEKNEVIITGRFLGEHPEEFGVTVPDSGTCYEGFTDRIRPDSTGNFKIILHADGPALVSFLFYDSPPLIVEPGNTYEIILNRNANHFVEMSGNLTETQKAYAALPHQHPMSCLYSYGEEFTNYLSIKQKLQADLQNEIAVFNGLYEQRKISHDLLDLLVTDRKIYYYTTQSVLASRNHLDKHSNKEPVPDEVFSMWSEAAYGVPLDDRFALMSYYSFDYLQMHLWYKIYTNVGFDDFVGLRAEKRTNSAMHAHMIELAREFLPDHTLEFYIAGSFFDHHKKRHYDQNLGKILDQFKTEFPGSPYTPFVEATTEAMPGH